MSSAIDYFKYLFINYKEPLKRNDLIAIAAILWFLNICSFFNNFPSMIMQMLAIHCFSVAEFAILSNFEKFKGMFWFGIPWKFILLTLAFLTVRRLYREKFKLYFLIIGGLLVFLFLSGMVAIPVYFFGSSLFISHDSQIYPVVNENIGMFIKMILPFCVAGLILFLLPFFKLNSEESSLKLKGKYIGLNRGEFTRTYFYASIVFTFIVLLILLYVHYVLSNDFKNIFIEIIFAIIGVLACATYIWLVVQRLRNSGKSLFNLAYFIAPGFILLIGIIPYYIHSFLGFSVVNLIIGIVAEIPSVFLLWLFFVPSESSLQAIENATE
jgi:uncharacterized membrane protein YhaH (DUF805 family)